MKNNLKKVAVVGSGVSGIATAYYLQKKGIQAELIEASDVVGGRTGSSMLGDERVDFGGKNIGRRYKLFREFVADVSKSEFEYHGINTSLIVDGKQVGFGHEKGITSLLRIVRLIGVLDFLKAARLAFIMRRNLELKFLGSDFFKRIAEKFDHQPIGAYFGKRFQKYLLRPLIVRMNGAEPDEYWYGNFGTNLLNAMDRYDQIRGTLHSVLSNYCNSLPVRLNSPVLSLIKNENSVTGVRIGSGNSVIEEHYDHVILATPANRASEIVASHFPELSAALKEVRYHPVALAVVRYQHNVFNPDTRALAFDSSHLLSNAGAYGTNHLNVVRYTFSGKKMSQAIDESTSVESLIQMGEDDIKPYFRIEGNPRVESTYRYIKSGLCGYSPYHHRLLDKIQTTCQGVQGLSLTGDYIRGASIEACFKAAQETVDRLVGNTH